MVPNDQSSFQVKVSGEESEDPLNPEYLPNLLFLLGQQSVQIGEVVLHGLSQPRVELTNVVLLQGELEVDELPGKEQVEVELEGSVRLEIEQQKDYWETHSLDVLEVRSELLLNSPRKCASKHSPQGESG